MPLTAICLICLCKIDIVSAVSLWARSHFEIIALMVESVKDGGNSRFSIMKRASINCGQLKRFLSSLVNMGFIQEDVKDGKVMYRASQRGLDFLRQYYVLLSMLLAAENGTRRSTVVYEPQLRQT
jgi:predicted transcriptional regulator